MKQQIDYSFLRGKIISKCGTTAAFAEKLGISPQELSSKLNNKSAFTQEQIFKSRFILSLDEKEMAKCFFCPSVVEKNSTR